MSSHMIGPIIGLSSLGGETPVLHDGLSCADGVVVLATLGLGWGVLRGTATLIQRLIRYHWSLAPEFSKDNMVDTMTPKTMRDYDPRPMECQTHMAPNSAGDEDQQLNSRDVHRFLFDLFAAFPAAWIGARCVVCLVRLRWLG